MTAKKWFKKILLFPLSLIMATEGAAEPSLNERIMQFAGNNSEFIPKSDVFREEEQDAAASEDDALGADQEGNPGETDETDDGLDTASDEEGAGADQGEEGDEEADETDQKDDEGKGTKKKTFEERMAEMEEKLRAEMRAEMEAKLQKAEPTKPDFVEVDMEAVNAYLATTEDKIEALKLEGNIFAAKKLQREMDKLLADIEANDAKKEAWEKAQKAKETGTAAQNQTLSRLDETQEFYRREMKIEPAVWDKMGAFFANECKEKPLIGKKFVEKVEKLGALEAVEWAHKYTVDHMGLEAKVAIAQKETNKTKTAAISSATAAGKDSSIDLKKIKAEFDENPTSENFARYQEAKRKAAK